jgi:hypothetical protein
VDLRELLTIPVVAGILGFLVGAVLIALTAWSRNIPKSHDPLDGLAWMMGFMAGGMLLSAAVLVAYVYAAPAGFLYFGLALAAGFVIGLAVISIGMMRKSSRD